jgi:hypothetical protein
MVFWVSFTAFRCYHLLLQAHQICRSYFEMRPLQLMQLVWSNLQKLFWNASSVATHATCLITLMPYRNTLELQLHMVTKNHRKVSFWKKHYTRTCRMKAQSISFLKIKRSAVVELCWSTLKVLGSKISRFTRFVTWTHDISSTNPIHRPQNCHSKMKEAMSYVHRRKMKSRKNKKTKPAQLQNNI